MLKTALLYSLLFAGAIVANADVNGYVSISNGFVRAQSNAQANQAVKKMVVLQDGDKFAFVTTSLNLTNNAANGTAANNTLSVMQTVVFVGVAPIPHTITTQSNLTVNMANFQFNSVSHGVAFPAAVEYNETNNIAGFQPGADTLVQAFDLRAQDNGLFAEIFGGQYEDLALTLETFPQSTAANSPNATVFAVKSCNVGNSNAQGFCFTFRFSNTTYVRNGVTYLPEAVKVDFLANLQNFKNPQDRLALLSSFLSTQDMAKLVDNHKQVDQTVANANAAGGVAVVGPDFIAQVNATANNTAVNNDTAAFGTVTAGYINFARTANLTSATNGNVTVSQVNAELISNDTVTGLIQINFDNVAADALTSDFAFTVNKQYIIYSFLTPVNGSASLIWDPESGTAAVSTSNYVAGGASASPISAGATAGIVIGVIAAIAVVGVAGFFLYKRSKAQGSSNTARLLI
jgi:hypothetical protein